MGGVSSLWVISLAANTIAYAWLAAMLAIRSYHNWQTRIFAMAAALTAAWAVSALILPTGQQSLVPILRDAAWIGMIISILYKDDPLQRLWKQLGGVAIGLIAADILLFALDLNFSLFGELRIGSWISRMAVAAFALLLIENIIRNSSRDHFWALKLFCIGLALIFSFNLVMEIPRAFSHTFNITLINTQPFIYLLALPLFVVTAVRLPTVGLRVHSSRQAVFHSATLIAIAVVIEGMAVAAYYVRTYGGDMGTVLSIVLLFSVAAAILTAAASATIRSKLKLLISENFFNHKYDYQVEWANSISSLSARDECDMPLRVLRTLADLLDCPGGLLLVHRGDEKKMVPLASWSIATPATPMLLDDKDIRTLENDSLSYIDMAGKSGDAQKWSRQYPSFWLGVPLRYRGRLVGFALLNQPRVKRKLDWEDKKLISIVALQLAIYLVHDKARKDLADARQLEAFNQRIAFVIHDMKSSIGQLSLLADNAERFGDNEQFRKDMVETIHHSSKKLQELMLRLKGEAIETPRIELVDLCVLLMKFAESKARLGMRVEFHPPMFPLALTEIDRAALLSALEHIVANAVDASPLSPVVISLDRVGETLRITVQDEGRGMPPTFLSDELFRPLRSSKGTGFGLGTLQAKQTMRDLQGDLEIKSKMGVGTTVALIIPTTGTRR
jgi:putative PEP-CTERM system histidine kinase